MIVLSLLFPTEEDSGILISSAAVNAHKCEWEREKRGQWGLSKGTEIEAVVSEHGASKGGSSPLCTVQRATIPSQRVIFFYNYKHYT